MAHIIGYMADIDPDKLKELFKKKKLNHERVAIELGISSRYFVVSRRRRRINMHIAERLEKEYGIPAAEYIVEPEPEVCIPEEETPEAPANIDIQELKETLESMHRTMKSIESMCNVLVRVWDH